MAVAGFVIAGRAVVFTWAAASELEHASALAELRPRAQSTIVFDRHGRPAFTFFVEQRIDVPLARISPVTIDAVLAVEDKRFFRHNGLDPIRIAGAAWTNLRARRIVQGGSTITQQLARASQLSPRRTFSRKIREAMMASRLEQRYSKAEILEAYLNTVYFGEGYYGIEAAARGYFGKTAAELDAGEAALLAAIVRSPSRDSPRVSPARARARRDLVLRLMAAQGRIPEPQLRLAVASSVPVTLPRKDPEASVVTGLTATGLYFQEELRRQLFGRFGSDRVLRGGLRVYSTYDPALQKAAEQAITERITQLAKSRRRAAELQGSLVAMDVATGDVLALVGGRNFGESRFNRATQARRQAGSAFKPFLFAAALERGYGPGTLLTELDVPLYQDGTEWLPAGEHERDEYTLRRALEVSSNRAAVQLMQQVGAGTTIYYAQRLGIESSLPSVPSLALGTGEVTLLELTSAYTAFANRGITSRPRLFTRVEDSSGVTIHHEQERHTQVVSEGTAYMMSSMLSDVIASGTATTVRAAGFRLPAAGKTGTTDEYADAWFIGYTPHLVTGVWFGLDAPAPIMTRGFGGTVAAPVWARFMKEATRGASPDWYEMPPEVERVAICRLSGARAAPSCRHQYVPAQTDVAADGELIPVLGLPPSEPAVYEELFPVGAIPSELCPLHGPQGIQGGYTGESEEIGSNTPLVDAELRRLATGLRPLRKHGPPNRSVFLQFFRGQTTAGPPWSGQGPPRQQHRQTEVGDVPGPADPALQLAAPEAPPEKDAHRNRRNRHQQQNPRRPLRQEPGREHRVQQQPQ
jgi:penicillin-binding protein 1A